MNFFFDLVLPVVIILGVAMLLSIYSRRYSKQKASPYHGKPTNSDHVLKDVQKHTSYVPYEDEHADRERGDIHGK